MISSTSQSIRLVLGTAQLGMPYGIANRRGQPDRRNAEAIVARVWENGVREFDTAQAYGGSETVLGNTLKSLGLTRQAKVISKIDAGIDHQHSASLRRALEQTIVRLNISKLYAIMIHSEELLDIWDMGLGATLHKFIEEGLVERIGISVYKPRNAIRALKTAGISLLQIPGNLLDRRFENEDVFEEALHRGKQIYLRSVFLQGLLLMNIRELNDAMDFALPVIDRLISFSKDIGYSVKQLALGYVKSAYPSTKVIFGCETTQQAQENFELWQKELPDEIVGRIQEEFHNIPDKILNPSLWAPNASTQR
jgi:aryl-alcohol dehydrogenase-like predicted oxidoreductase